MVSDGEVRTSLMVTRRRERLYTCTLDTADGSLFIYIFIYLRFNDAVFNSRQKAKFRPLRRAGAKWGPPSVVSNVYRGAERPGREADHLYHLVSALRVCGALPSKNFLGTCVRLDN